jgi:ABC-type transport system substrate-binding protein
MYVALANDPNRAAQSFAEAGWIRGSDGLLTNSQGRHLEIVLSGTRERWAAAAVDMWKRAGVDAGLHVTTAAESRDREYQQAYPAADFGGSSNGDRIFQRLDPNNVPTERNGFNGNNRGHYLNPRLSTLIDQYRSSIAEADRGNLMRQITELVGDELPLLNMSYIPIFGTVRREVRALQDLSGGNSGIGSYFGSYTRNAHLWERD